MLEEYRRLVGHVPTAGTPLRPRTRLALSTARYKLYHVLLDVTGGVELYGHLLVPAGLRGRAAAVIAQHGLSGTPQLISGLGQRRDTPYHEFGRRLAERGYVVFAPLILHHHPVKQVNDQVVLAEAAGMMRVAMVAAKTRRVVDFLQGLPFVAPDRIGYYGLSYGGYSGLWVGPLEPRLKAIVVSGHFNDWRTKITTDTTGTSYLLHPDEDFYNWDTLHRFTHPELIAMTLPRAVCIEHGLRDGITTPQWTAYAWKQLLAICKHANMADRVELVQFDGVHEVRAVETFEFLDRFIGPTGE
jgi:dienelactone hydrolase